MNIMHMRLPADLKLSPSLEDHILDCCLVSGP